VVATLAVAVAVTAIVVATSGSSSSTARPPKPTSSTESPASTASTTTTAPALVRTPTDAAQQLYFAWQRGDRSSAERLATTAAIRSVFEIPSTKAAGLAFDGCTEPRGGSSTCSWIRDGARLAMRVQVTTSGEPQVQTVELS
jgi:hypothetical protein